MEKRQRKSRVKTRAKTRLKSRANTTQRGAFLPLSKISRKPAKTFLRTEKVKNVKK
jgi:hypothetical protein